MPHSFKEYFLVGPENSAEDFVAQVSVASSYFCQENDKHDLHEWLKCLALTDLSESCKSIDLELLPGTMP
jgi:hypothetical protein